MGRAAAPLRVVLALALLAGAAGCAAGGASAGRPAPPPEPRGPLDSTSVEAVADLLEMEDRAELRISRIALHAVSPDPEVRSRAALAIASVGDPAGLTFLRDLLTDSDTAVAAAAAFGLGVLRDTPSVPGLLARLAPPRDTAAPTVAAEAALALGRIRTPEADAALTNYLLGVDPGSGAAVVPVLESVLAAAGGAEDLDPRSLLRWIDHPNPRLRAGAAHALAGTAGPAVLPRLIPLLDDPDSDVRAAALAAVAEAVGKGAEGDPGDIAPRLLPLLDDSTAAVRVEAIRAAAALRAQPAAARLVGIARAGPPQERAAAIRGLGDAGFDAAGASAALRAIALDPAGPAFLRAEAVRAVLALDPSPADGLLDDLRDDTSWRVRAALVAGLPGDGAASLPGLRPFLRDRDPRVSGAALDALFDRVGDRPDLLRPFLIEAAYAGDLHLRAAALRGLARTGDLALFPVLLDAYAAAEADLEPDARLAAVDALADLRDAGVLVAPERAFFARFGPPQDERVRERVYARFGAAARRFWGGPLPTESPRGRDAYLEQVVRWIAPADPAAARPVLRVDTDRGSFTLELLADHAPLTAANFLALAGVGYFDGQEIVELAPNAFLLAGDPRGDGSGGPGYLLRRELSRGAPGEVAMAARGGALHGSQFTVRFGGHPGAPEASPFAHVSAGWDVLRSLLPGDRILSVRVIEGEE